MAKLYFRYGTVGSAKTLNLLAVAHNYRQQGKKVLLIKPALDDRWGVADIVSRAGLSQPADLLVDANTILDSNSFAGTHCVLVDEAQFLAAAVIDQLRALTEKQRVPVICYGLRTDFKSNLFEGARRLMEIADAIEEVKTTCAYCNKKAIYNLKFTDGIPTLHGQSIDLGAEEKYAPACHGCYNEKLREAGELPPL